MNDLELFSKYQKNCPLFFKHPTGDAFCANRTGVNSIYSGCRLISCPVFYWINVLQDYKRGEIE